MYMKQCNEWVCENYFLVKRVPGCRKLEKPCFRVHFWIFFTKSPGMAWLQNGKTPQLVHCVGSCLQFLTQTVREPSCFPLPVFPSSALTTPLDN